MNSIKKTLLPSVPGRPANDGRRLPLAPTGGEGWGEGAAPDIFGAHISLLTFFLNIK